MKLNPADERNSLSLYPTPYLAIAAAVIAGFLWYIFPSLGVLPLALGIAPWFMRSSDKKRHLMFVQLYGPLLLLFLLTALLGVWLAYDRAAAWWKFWILIDAALLFYAVANVRSRQLWTIVRFLGIAGALVAVYFLMTHNWKTIPAGIDIIDKIGRGWMSIRPGLRLPIIHPNRAAGIMVMLLPYALATAVYEWQSRREERFHLLVICIFVIGVGLLMTASRGAVIALIVGLSVWLLWSASKWVEQVFNLPQPLVYTFMLVSPVVVLILTLLLLQGDSGALVANLPGMGTFFSRASLFRDTLNLTAAFPFTGAGLATFPGLYSQYIERIPVPFYYYGHNLYLDLLLEQGPLGLLTFVGLGGGASYHLWASGRRRSSQERKRVRSLSLLRWAVFSSIVIVALHGLVDDALYSERGMPLLFLPLGMALAVSLATSRQRPFLPQVNFSAVLMLVFVGPGLAFFRPVRAAWYENVAAVQMAQVELANWPTGRWFDDSYVASLAPAKKLLVTAVALDPDNFNVQYRLGQIALLDGDFETAVDHLEIAFQHNRSHRGIQKALAYSYTWAGQIDKAFPLLVNLPGSAREMATYAEWWQKENREDLAGFAVQMAEQLNAAPAQ